MTESDPPQKAVALKYDLENAPKVVAKGDGHLADKIIEIAEEHGIVLYQDSHLVKLLSRLEIDEEIPSNLYQAVAVVLSFVFQLNGKQAQVTKQYQKQNEQQKYDSSDNNSSDSQTS